MDGLRTRQVTAIVLLCLALRLGFFLAVQPWKPEVERTVLLQDDPLGYHNLASTLVKSHRFATSDIADPNSVRTPLYPLFIAAHYWLLGEKPWLAILSQIVIGSLTCVVLLVTLWQFFEPRIAMIAAILFAVDPNNILHSNLLYSEIVFVFFLVIGFYLFSVAVLSSSRTTTLTGFVLYGISLGVATLVRPISLFLPLIIVALFLVWYRRRIVTGIKYSVIVLFFFAATLSPWLIRNYRTFGSFSLSSVGSDVVLLYNVAYMEMPKRHQDINTVRTALIGEAKEMMVWSGQPPDSAGAFQLAMFMNQLAAKYVRADPVDFMKRYCLGVLNVLFSPATSAYSRALRLPDAKVEAKSHVGMTESIRDFVARKGLVHYIIAVIVLLFSCVVYLGFIVGIVTSWGKYQNRVLIFCLLTAAYLVLTGALTAYARFRLPATPFALPFAAIGYDWLWRRLGQDKKTESGEAVRQRADDENVEMTARTGKISNH